MASVSLLRLAALLALSPGSLGAGCSNGCFQPLASNTAMDPGDSVGCSFVDDAGEYGYFGAGDSNYVMRMRLSDMQYLRASTTGLPGSVTRFSAAAYDGLRGYAYFATSSTQGRVARLNLTTFQFEASAPVSLPHSAYSAVLDSAAGYLYVATRNQTPGVRIDRIAVPSLQIERSVDVPGRSYPKSAAIDPQRGVAYFGTDDGQIIRLALDGNLSVTLLAAGAGQLRSAAIDLPGGYVYFASQDSGGPVVRQPMTGGAVESIIPTPTQWALVQVDARSRQLYAVAAGARVYAIDLATFADPFVGREYNLSCSSISAIVVDPVGSDFMYVACGRTIFRVERFTSRPSTTRAAVAVSTGVWPGTAGLPSEGLVAAPDDEAAGQCVRDEFTINYKNTTMFRVDRTTGTCWCRSFQTPGSLTALSINVTTLHTTSVVVSDEFTVHTLNVTGDLVLNGTSLTQRLASIDETLLNHTALLANMSDWIASQLAEVDALLNRTSTTG